MSEKSITLTAERTDAEALVIALAEIQSGTEDHGAGARWAAHESQVRSPGGCQISALRPLARVPSQIPTTWSR
jgi:hypothetical protein